MDGATRAVTLQSARIPGDRSFGVRQSSSALRAIGVWPKNARYGSCVGRVQHPPELVDEDDDAAVGHRERVAPQREAVPERRVRHGQWVRPLPRKERR